MNAEKTIVNSRALTDSEVESLVMALEMAIIDLEGSPVDSSIKGIGITKHLTNIATLIELIRGESWLDPKTPSAVNIQGFTSSD